MERPNEKNIDTSDKNLILFGEGDGKFSMIKKPEKFREANRSAEVHKLITAIELSHSKIAREIAFSQSFIDENLAFVKSGEAIHLCLKRGNFELAEDLIAHGYPAPVDFLLNAIRSNDMTLASSLIRGKYFGENVELEFWFLIYRGMNDLADDLRFASTKLKLVYGDLSNLEPLKKDASLIKLCLKSALVRNCEDLSGILLQICPEAISPELVQLALENNNVDFLRRIWVGDHAVNAYNQMQRRRGKGKIIKLLMKSASPEQQSQINKALDISLIIDYLLSNKRLSDARRVLAWPEAIEQPHILEVLIRFSQQDLARYVIKKRKNLISVADFHMSLTTKSYWLAREILAYPHTRAVLKNHTIQETLVELLKDGENCIYAAEMLALIKLKNWDYELSKAVCENLDFFIKKSSEILKCKKPLLFLVLAGEFVKRVGESSLLYGGLCLGTLDSILAFTKELENNIINEEFLQHYLLQKDITDRTALLVISFNSFYSLLNHEDIGSIVGNLWVGERKHIGMLKASTLYNSSNAHSLEGSLGFFQRGDKMKPYIFQYDQWTDSCSLRFLGQAVSTLMLVYFYTMMIHSATLSNNMEDVSKDPTALIYLRICQVWVGGIAIEKFLHYLFQLKTGRKRLLDRWAVLDFAMLVQMLILMLGLNQEYSGEGKTFDSIEPKDFNALMHGVMLALIWSRLLAVLIPTILYGSLLKMIALILVRLVAFFFILFVIYFASAVIFTAFFMDYSTNMISFSESFRTLYSASYNNYNLEQFSNTSVRYLGEILYAAYIFFTYVLMRNFLIAILSYVYEELSVLVESEYRATLIAYHNKWEWDENYGILIMLPPPMTWIVLTIVPFLVTSSRPRSLNSFFARVFFVLFVLPQFALFAGLSALYVPAVYLGSIISFARTGNKRRKLVNIIKQHRSGEESESEEDENSTDAGTVKYKAFSYQRAIIWVIVGPVLVLGAWGRDLLDMWALVYTRVETKKSVKKTPVINEQFFKSVQKYLRTLKVEEKPLEEFVNEFHEVDWNYLNAVMKNNKEYLENRKRVIHDFFALFVNSRKDSIVNIPLLRVLLPKQSIYPNSYIREAKFTCIPWMVKAINHYRTLIGGVEYEGVLIPKSLVTGENTQFKKIKVVGLRAVVTCWEISDINNQILQSIDKLNLMLDEIRDSNEGILEYDAIAHDVSREIAEFPQDS